MQLWWNDNDGKESKYLGFNLSRCQFIHDKPHMEFPVAEPGPLQ